jgi:tRNA(fMet)-specific endonuclease VapC
MLDTNICVDLIRGRAPRVFDRLRQHRVDEVAISSITLAEMHYGVARSTRPARHAVLLAQFCAPLIILPFDSQAAEVYGQVRTALEREGTPIGPLDTLIAAHALSLGVALITNNEREFRRVADLRVENWLTQE